MTESWSASLVLINNNSNREFTIKYNFYPPYTYNELYNEIIDIYDIIGWSENTKIIKRNIILKLFTNGENLIKITNWNKYLLDDDKIYIILYNSDKVEYALYTEKGAKLIQANKTDIIYNDIDYDNITEPLLLYSVTETGDKIKLLDVIDTPKRWYNEIVTRMVLKNRSII